MKRIFLMLGISAFIFSCAPTTQITGSWKNPKATERSYKTIFVAALTSNTIAKSTLENNMSAALGKYGITSIRSMDEFPPAFFKDSVSKDALIDKVHKKGNDAILTISILKKTTEQRYMNGGYAYAPMTRFGYYGSFGGYYSYWSPYAYSPGYYTEDDIYFLETNLYDSATEVLLWSAQSETYSFDGLASFSKEFARIIINQMRADGVLINTKTK